MEIMSRTMSRKKLNMDAIKSSGIIIIPRKLPFSSDPLSPYFRYAYPDYCNSKYRNQLNSKSLQDKLQSLSLFRVALHVLRE
jgi:hypothetical protein